MSRPRTITRSLKKHSKWNEHDDVTPRILKSIRRSDVIEVAQDERHELFTLGRCRLTTATAAFDRASGITPAAIGRRCISMSILESLCPNEPPMSGGKTPWSTVWGLCSQEISSGWEVSYSTKQSTMLTISPGTSDLSESFHHISRTAPESG